MAICSSPEEGLRWSKANEGSTVASSDVVAINFCELAAGALRHNNSSSNNNNNNNNNHHYHYLYHSLELARRTSEKQREGAVEGQVSLYSKLLLYRWIMLQGRIH